MTSLTAETRLVGSGLAILPRVNLLPPEIAEKRRFRQVQYGLGAGVVAALGVVGLLFLAAASSVSSANDNVAAAGTRHTQLQVETAKYADVTGVYARAAAAQAMLTQAMGQEVRYSQLMNDLSLRVPENVWVKNLTFTQGAAPTPVGSSTPGIGTVAVTGIAFSHDDVAVWLESLAGQKAYADPDFSSSSEFLIGTRKAVNFTSTANLTQAALSGRFTKPAGG